MVGLATETDTGLALTAGQAVLVGLATETNQAFTIVGQVPVTTTVILLTNVAALDGPDLQSVRLL